jgi:hypothetical protein
VEVNQQGASCLLKAQHHSFQFSHLLLSSLQERERLKTREFLETLEVGK